MHSSAIRLRGSAFLLATIGISLAAGASTPDGTALDVALIQARSKLVLKDGALTGSAGDLIRKEIVDSHFVLIGEDHGTAEIPAFSAAVCRVTGPLGFRSMAIETGAQVTGEVQSWLGRDDRLTRLAAYNKQYPFSLAFYNWREENDLLEQCNQAAGGSLRLWGLDQELMGSAGFLLHRMEETHPGGGIATALKRLTEADRAAYAKAESSGNPNDMYLMAASDRELSDFGQLLAHDGNSEAQAAFAGLLASRSIYAKFNAQLGWESNRERARLMKANFRQAYEAAGTSPKVLFKFGANHMFRGLNPLESSEIGNYVAELAEGHEWKSLHILIVGVKGKQLRFAGVGRPGAVLPFDAAADKDSNLHLLAPLFKNLDSGCWTVFDLRSLRPKLATYQAAPEFKRVITGFDLAVLIPEATPSHEVR